MVWAGRFERPACGFQVRRSAKMSYAQARLTNAASAALRSAGSSDQDEHAATYYQVAAECAT